MRISAMIVFIFLAMGACASARREVFSAKPLAALPGSTPVGNCSLSEGIGRSIVGKMRVTVYASAGFPAVDIFARRLEANLSRVHANAPKHVDYELRVAPSGEGEWDEAANLGIAQGAYAESGKTTPHGYYMGVVFEYGVERGPISCFDLDAPEKTVDYLLAEAMRIVRDREEKRTRHIGLVSGSGAFDRGETPNRTSRKTFGSLFAAEFPYDVLERVDLGRDEPLSPLLAGLVITQPRADFSDAELRRIDDIVMSGKPLVIFASAVNLTPNDTSMRATLGTHRLDRLLREYGVEMHHDLVLGSGPSKLRMFVKHGNVSSIAYPPIIRWSSGPDAFPPMLSRWRDRTLSDVLVPFASSLGIDHAAQPFARIQVIAEAAGQAVTESEPTIDLSPTRQWADASAGQSFVIGATIEGRIRSAFNRERVSEPTARVLILSSSELLANPFIRASQPGAEQMVPLADAYDERLGETRSWNVFANVVDWMTLPQELVSCAP